MALPRFATVATSSFVDDLSAAALWRLANVGSASAERLLDAYDALMPLESDAEG